MIKNYFLTFLVVLLTGLLWAQSPQKMSYQAIITDSSNIIVKEAPVGLRISILQGNPNYTPVYEETHTPYTNSNGLISLEIGTGNVLSGSFSNINWGAGPCFIKTEIDIKGGTNYTITDTSELLSTPYALYSTYAMTSANGMPLGTAAGQMNYWNGTSWVTIAPGTNGQYFNFCNGIPAWTNNGQCPGSISGLNCGSANHYGVLTPGIVASGVSSSIPYSSGGGGNHGGQTVTSTGVTGLTATLESGTFSVGSGALTYTINGTPSASGTASFTLNIGGQTCNLSRSVNLPLGVITALNCANAINTAALTQGLPASNFSSSIPYTGGNGGTFSSQTVSSTGVSGLTAALDAGTFATGNGSLMYAISGTPGSSGTAVFALNIGGKSCNLTITVNQSLASGQYAAGTVHCSGTPTAIIDVTNPTTGKTWMDRNLGASQTAATSTDASSYGDLYQWGRAADGHQCRTSTTTSTVSSSDMPGNSNFIIGSSVSLWDWRTPQNNNLWQGVNGINNPCPGGYRLPTATELDAERLSWSSQNSIGALASMLRLPLSGSRRWTNGSLINVGLGGFYWTSTIESAVNGEFPNEIDFASGTESSARLTNNNRAYAYSVRCIKE